MKKIKQMLIIKEMVKHAPFTALGAASGILLLILAHSCGIISNISPNISHLVFCIAHPAHVLLSAFVTTSMYRLHRGNRGRGIWAFIIGYTGSVSICTISDILLPFLGGILISNKLEFHVGCIEEWWLVNSSAILGVILGYLKPLTRCPHAGHVFLSTTASLFYLLAFGIINNLILVIPIIFLILFISVWVPCCFSDIIFPLLFVKEGDCKKRG